MRKVFGNRNIALVRELTKIHEEVLRFTFDEAIEYYSDKSPKGEYVIIIEGKKEDINEDITLEMAVEMAKILWKRVCRLIMRLRKQHRKHLLKKATYIRR